MSGAGTVRIELSWPAKELSPNARVHHMALHRFKKAAKTEAQLATKIARPFDWGHDGPLAIHITAHPPKAWRTGDDDNLTARMKAALDGIAEALGVNDRQFSNPTIEWADRTERGKIIVSVSPESRLGWTEHAG